MGLLDRFRPLHHPDPRHSDNGQAGPTYLEGFTEPLPHNRLHSHEWRRRLKLASGQTKFKIKYFGKRHEEEHNLIIGTEEAPALVYAVDENSQKEILLFDGCKYGYHAMFCDVHTEEEINRRHPDTWYRDSEGNDLFELTIVTYNCAEFDKELPDLVDQEGMIELINGTRIKFETAKRDCFDTFHLFATNSHGKTFEILAEDFA
jgi:hypothetical protein